LTGNVLIDLAILAAGVALLAAAAWAVFGARPAPIDMEHAAERLAFDEPDFEAVRWLSDEAGSAALARNLKGETALVLTHGDGLVSRRFRAGAMPARYEDGRLIVERADATARRAAFALSADEAALWLAREGLHSLTKEPGNA